MLCVLTNENGSLLCYQRSYFCIRMCNKILVFFVHLFFNERRQKTPIENKDTNLCVQSYAKLCLDVQSYAKLCLDVQTPRSLSLPNSKFQTKRPPANRVHLRLTRTQDFPGAHPSVC